MVLEAGPRPAARLRGYPRTERSIDPEKWDRGQATSVTCTASTAVHRTSSCSPGRSSRRRGGLGAAADRDVPAGQRLRAAGPWPFELPAPTTVGAAKRIYPRRDWHAAAPGHPDGTAVAYRTLRAVYELQRFDMFVWMYYLIRGIAREERFAEIERLIMLDTQTHFIPRPPSEREHFYKGKSEGKAEAEPRQSRGQSRRQG